jgi:hypothetical protein
MLHPEYYRRLCAKAAWKKDYVTVHARCRDEVSESQVLGLGVADFKTVITKANERHN